MANDVYGRELAATLDEAREAAERYQRGFDARYLREGKLEKGRLDYFGDVIRFAIADTADGPPDPVSREYTAQMVAAGKFAAGGNVQIIVDLRRRRVWTDFDEGAGVDF